MRLFLHDKVLSNLLVRRCSSVSCAAKQLGLCSCLEGSFVVISSQDIDFFPFTVSMQHVSHLLSIMVRLARPYHSKSLEI